MKTAIMPVEVTFDEARHHHRWIFSPAARPLRFVVAGISASAVQITVLSILVFYRLSPEWANAGAVFSGMQANFIFSSFFTWHDQPARGVGALMGRWLRFVTTLSGTALINEGIFLVLFHALPIIVASIVASSLVAALNYTLGKRFIFSRQA